MGDPQDAGVVNVSPNIDMRSLASALLHSALAFTLSSEKIPTSVSQKMIFLPYLFTNFVGSPPFNILKRIETRQIGTIRYRGHKSNLVKSLLIIANSY